MTTTNTVLVLFLLKFLATSCLDPAACKSDFPKLENLKTRMSSVIKAMDVTTTSSRHLIRDNISNAKNTTTYKFTTTRSFLNRLKQDPSYSKSCLNSYTIELSKFSTNFLACKCNNTALSETKTKVVKLQNVATSLLATCTRLNPLASECQNFLLCIKSKVADLNLELDIFEKQFVHNVRDALSNSTACIVEESGRFLKQLGSVEGATKNCKTSN